MLVAWSERCGCCVMKAFCDMLERGRSAMNLNKKIAIVVRDDLLPWQELNVTAFLASGFGTLDVMGENYMDKSGKRYLPMSGQPILVYSATKDEMKDILKKAGGREIDISVYNEEMFKTSNDVDNRAQISKYETEEIEPVGLGLCGKKQHIDKTLHGCKLHP